MLNKLKFWVLLFILVSSVAVTHAQDEDSSLPTVRLDELSVEKLEELQQELKIHIQLVRRIANRSDSGRIDVSPIKHLATIPVEEAADALLDLTNREAARSDPDFRPDVLGYATEGLGRIASKSPEKYLNYIKRLEAHVEGMPKFSAHLKDVIKRIESRTSTLQNLANYTSHRKRMELEAKTTPQEKLTAIENWLRAQVIGQPEVIQALMDLEWRNALYGAKERSLPDVIYMMGLPGTGKDTAAESFTDALHGEEGAYEKHMFRVKPMKNHSDTFKLFGSSTGFVGSDNFPPFLDFLVKHSNGRYKLEEELNPMGKKTIRVVVNPEYQGQTLPGYFPPNKGVVFLNEFHNWAKQFKDDVVKEALEKGYFSINNPNGGLAEIFVPIRFIIASNEGIGLVTSREANGQRHGRALTYDEVLQKWEKVQSNKPALKNDILATNGSPNNKSPGESSTGISEELLNRVPERFILLMRPLNPTDLQTIVELALQKAVRKIQRSSDLLRDVTLTFAPEVVKVIQEYDYSAEDNARPVKDRIIGFVEEPLLDAIRSGVLKVKPGARLQIGLAQNEDRTRRLTVQISEGGKTREVAQLIRTTLKDIPAAAMSDERIEQLANLGEELKSRVFGIDNIVERIAQRIVSIENDGASGQERRATVLMLNGLSSTGKTELAKQLGRILTQANGGSGGELKTFDFSQIQSLDDFKAKILGIRDERGNPIASDFMKHYDRNNGNVIVAFDELANVRDPRLLTALYDFFREETVSTFSDGKPRPMGGVKVIITGNAGKEIYDRVPRHLPMAVQMAAWQEIYEQANRDFEFQLTFLERSYPSPLLARVGRNNIFFMPPHNFRSLRQLAQLKLGEALTRVKDSNSRRGWVIQLPSVEEYSRLIDTIVDEGFTLRNQGASIESFIRDDIEEPIKYLLLKNKIPADARVRVQYSHSTDNQNPDVPGKVIYQLIVDGREPIQLEIQRQYVPKELPANRTHLIITAYHEAGHSIAQQILFNGAYAPIKISIIPGVGLIAGEWIYYAGIAKHLQQEEVPHIREFFVRQIAVFAAGETAERLVTRGARDSSGKSNDMERATLMARDAIVRYGLSAKWGTHAIPSGVTIDAYVAGLSEERKQLLESETEDMVKEGRDLAQRTLERHFESHLVPLGTALAEKGEMNHEDLAKFYADRKAMVVEPSILSTAQRGYLRLKTLWRHWIYRPTQPMAVELIPSVPEPAKIADITKIAAERKAAQYATVTLPSSIPWVSEAHNVTASTYNVLPLRTPGSVEAIVASARVRLRCMEAHLSRSR